MWIPNPWDVGCPCPLQFDIWMIDFRQKENKRKEPVEHKKVCRTRFRKNFNCMGLLSCGGWVGPQFHIIGWGGAEIERIVSTPTDWACRSWSELEVGGIGGMYWAIGMEREEKFYMNWEYLSCNYYFTCYVIDSV